MVIPASLPPQRLGAWHFEDLFDLPDDGRRYEIFDGSLIVTSPPALPHAGVLHRLRRALEPLAPGTLAMGGDLGILSGDGAYFFTPDLVVFGSDLLGTSLAALPSTAARLVIEVVSPDNPRNDLVLKRHGYAAAGIARYWIVDGRSREVCVLTRPGPGGYLAEERHTTVLRSTDPFPHDLELAAIFG